MSQDNLIGVMEIGSAHTRLLVSQWDACFTYQIPGETVL